MSPSDFLAECPGLSGLSAYMRPLTVADAKSCVVVESTFPEQERCSEEKVNKKLLPSPPTKDIILNSIKLKYRLTVCPNLNIGLFIKTPTGDRQIGHVLGARISSNAITEASMGMPDHWQSLPSNEPVILDGKIVGNNPNGGNVAIHSVVTVPEFQGKGVGKTMVKAYVEYIRGREKGVRRIVLIAHDYLVGFYEQGGFENRGVSECRFAGGLWMDLVSLLDES